MNLDEVCSRFNELTKENILFLQTNLAFESFDNFEKNLVFFCFKNQIAAKA